MAPSDYKQLKVLVLDDFKQFLDTVRRMLEEIGIRKIDLVANSEQAAKLCESTQYDIIFCDYNLGKGKRNGFQFLELLRSKGVSRYKTIFIMVTAEVAKEMVMATYDIAPDAYITKPFNFVILKQRLDKLLAKSRTLKPIFSAIDQEDTASAIEICEAQILTNGRYGGDIKKTLVGLYQQSQQLDKAEELLKDILQNRQLDWALVELGRIKFLQSDHFNAEKCLQTAIEVNKYCLHAYDLLAELYRTTDRKEESLKLQKEVTEISPLSIQRQNTLAEIAEENYDTKTAANAYLNCVRLATHSAHNIPDYYLNLGRTTASLIQEDKENGESFTHKALSALDQAEEQFRYNKNRHTQKTLIEAQIYAALDEKIKTREYLNHAEKELDRDDANFSLQTQIDWLDALYASGRSDKAKEVLDRLLVEYKDDQAALKRLDKFLEEPASKENREEVAKLNRKGIQFYQEKHYNDSIQLLQRAKRQFPKHMGIQLNLVQALLSSIEEAPHNFEHIETCEKTLNAVSKLIQVNHNQFPRFSSLTAKAKALDLKLSYAV